MDTDGLAQGVLQGQRRAVARAISVVEAQGPQAHALTSALYAHGGKAHLVGITGAPGTGKSTLVGQLAGAYRRQGQRVGILAVDPSSPLSGGAVLGDRIRMRDLAGDSGVFIRSLATRGAQGGLARATRDAALILDAAGFEAILIETVGAGQDEVEVMRTAHTTVVVEAPGLGDDVQALKAGLIEVADILVVNKTDREGADRTAHILQEMLDRCTVPWKPPVCRTIALDGTGVDDLLVAIEEHQTYLKSGPGTQHELERARAELERLLQEALLTRFLKDLGPDKLKQTISRVAARQVSPSEALKEWGID